ncbi:branched-chain amino acid transport system II carrier protein, partial [Shewanella sp. A25]|nr:branched-chain amino acid transport system II carrier protein [Shewanella shenzhenensis]
GKVLTPLLIALLIGLAISVIIFASGTMPQPIEDYATHPLSKGIIDGYGTMDTLASLMFGMLIIDLLRKKGVDDVALQTRYLVRAAFIA